MIKPNFFIVGYPKTGTTSLHNWLDQHPEIYMSDVKEPNFFCTDFHKESDSFHGNEVYFKFRNEDDYLELFNQAKDVNIIGESSVNYIVSKVAAEEIHDFNPDSKILIVVREPISFLKSYHSHNLRDLNENINNLEDSIKKGVDRKEDEFPNRVIFPSQLDYDRYIKYISQINRYLNKFNSENVKVMIFDDFKENNAEFYTEILDFLDVNNKDFKPRFARYNKSKEVSFIFLRRFIEWIKSFSLISKLPLSLRRLIGDFLVRLSTKELDKEDLDPSTRMRLKKKFKPEVKKLSSLLDRDLVSEWGYDNL